MPGIALGSGLHRTPRLTLLPIDTRADAARLEGTFDAPTIYAADWYVDAVERGEEVPGGYAVGRVVNVDHHADTERMRWPISSAPLALERVRAVGVPGPKDHVVLTHTDCDSVLSAAILLGLLPADDRLGAAAIAADHTGVEDPLADTLQAVDHCRDWELSLDLARRILDGKPLPANITAAVDSRRADRARAADVAATARRVGVVACIRAEEELGGEFLPASLPDAAVIVFASRRPGSAERWNVKLRLGAAAPPGSSLLKLGLEGYDRNIGGRWNAMSNKRLGGTVADPDDYAAEVARRFGLLAGPAGATGS
jgi:hypothetical protein